MESQLKHRMFHELRRATGVERVGTDKIAGPFHERLYRAMVPEDVEQDVLNFRHQEFVTTSENFICKIVRTNEAFYVRLPTSRPTPPAARVDIREGTPLDNELKAAVDAANASILDKLQTLEAVQKFVATCEDHRELYQLWPSVTRYMRDLYLGRSRKWPTRVKTRYKRKLTEEEKLVLGKFTLMMGTP